MLTKLHGRSPPDGKHRGRPDVCHLKRIAAIAPFDICLGVTIRQKMRPRTRIAAYPAAFVCDASRAKQCRYSIGPTDARSRRYRDDADLHTHHQRRAKEKL